MDYVMKFHNEADCEGLEDKDIFRFVKIMINHLQILRMKKQ